MSDRLCDFCSGCMPQPRDMLVAPDPTPLQGLSSDGCQLLHWTSQVWDAETTTASQGQEIRQGEEAASGTAANMHAHHQTGSL